jgi:hypothetical protein
MNGAGFAAEYKFIQHLQMIMHEASKLLEMKSTQFQP